MTDQNWRARAACRNVNPAVFFPSMTPGRPEPRPDDAVWAHARIICARCPVTADCEREHADEPSGVWFGTTPAQRRSRIPSDA